MHIMRRRFYLLAIALLAAVLPLQAQEAAMWGFSPSRNMVSAAKNLPIQWNPDSGQGILWSTPLGSQTYGGPILFGGRLYVGTNNQGERHPDVKGDRGVVMAFNAADGGFLWQAAHAKLPAGRVNDWPQQGVCSAPYIEGERLYYVSNRCEVVALDTEGFSDGENDGAVTDEARTGATDADFIWSYDMIDELDVFPHNLATSSPLAVGDLLYVVTSNGVDEGHVHIPSPQAPSFIALNKNTGELVWEDASPGEHILHGQWTNPAYGVIGGRAQVIFPGGDGWVYSLDALTGELVWKFDCNPKESVWELGGRGSRNNIISTPVVYDDKVFLAVGQDPEHGEGEGHLWAIDATGSGDITETGAVWHWGGKDFNRTMSTASIQDGLLYLADLSGFVYCLDVATGKHHWTYDTFAAVWGSTLVADGKVYIGDEDGDVAVLKAGTQLKVLAEINMGSAVYTTPIAQDGVIYIATRNTLFAIGEGKPHER
ncbi:MAG: PQQ-binding-like beta-propeller repeat protein [Candidatus Latescibacteria bacterium]|nr:PQQ-binding-like beta-propeller repeat protein [Candidatus Latescibacterota bacterium]